MKLVYIAGPYRGATPNAMRENIRRAEERAADAVRAGHYPIVPHLCTAWMDGIAPDQHFLDGTLEAMKRCDEVWLCEGWRDSHGSKLEVATALASGIPIKDIDGSRVNLLTIHAERRRKG